MPDRLRRLDALFAERVLGHRITEMPVKSVYNGEVTRLPFIHPGNIPVCMPPYTRSLDAAWEGYEKICSGLDQNPAEALVLACLRAVGVKEEELV